MTVHVLDQLPLWVEGDLSGPEKTVVDQHLACCPSCCEAAENLRTSQAWLQDAMKSPFDAADHERLRQRVMDQVRSTPSRPVGRDLLRPSLLATAAALLLLATLTWAQHRHPTTSAPDPLPAVPRPDRALEAVQKPLPLQPALEAVRVAALPHGQTQIARSKSTGAPARIEFQTADPTIRIIWLTQTRPLPEPAPILEEKS